MPDGFNSLGADDWVSAPLPNLGVNDWLAAAPPPPPKPPPPPSGTLAGMGKAAAQLPTDIIGGLTKDVGALVKSGGRRCKVPPATPRISPASRDVFARMGLSLASQPVRFL
jgi:hypothetical protein